VGTGHWQEKIEHNHFYQKCHQYTEPFKVEQQLILKTRSIWKNSSLSRLMPHQMALWAIMEVVLLEEDILVTISLINLSNTIKVSSKMLIICLILTHLVVFQMDSIHQCVRYMEVLIMLRATLQAQQALETEKQDQSTSE